MKQLWAPWRMTYIAGEDPSAGKGCIFCLRDSADEDVARQVLYRGEHAVVIMNRYPYTNGHLMIAPFRHTAELSELSPDEVLEMYNLTALAQKILKETMQPQGFNLGMNLGRAAGAGVEDHLHLHLVPRWIGDTNFMPVFDEVRVIPQHLEATYVLLRRHFQQLGD